MAIPIFDEINKLINEHGSAAILRERIMLAHERYSTLQDSVRILETQNIKLQAENQLLQTQLQEAKLEIENLKQRTNQASNPHGYVCDHCGSPRLQRTGSRPDPMFGRLGVKQSLFTCEDCGEQSAFTPQS